MEYHSWPHDSSFMGLFNFYLGISRMLEPLIDWAALRYQAIVGSELKKYGLRYDDLYDPLYSLNIAEALERLPQEVVDARNQRLKRAIDLNLKHTYLSKEMQEKQTPFNFYLQDSYRQVLEEVEERALLGTGKQYERQIP